MEVSRDALRAEITYTPSSPTVQSRTLQKYEVLRGGNLVGIEPITGQSSDGADTKCRGTRPGSGSTEKIAACIYH